MDQRISDWIDSHRTELVEDVKALCAIPSVEGAYVEGKPFGEEPFRALHLTLSLCGKYGMSVTNYENYVGAADLDAALPRSLDILAHTDVVPAGEGWTVTEPFRVLEKDGRLYGRGTSDDKGPLLAALYAMRAVKELGIPLKKGVRLIVGSNEETGSRDIRHYYEKEPEAEMTFSPDGDFPVVNIEKGHLRGTIQNQYTALQGNRVLSLKAGVALNAVPQKAVLKLSGIDFAVIDAEIAEVEKKCQVKISFSGENEISVFGESAHASTPEHGKNAGLAALELLVLLPINEEQKGDAEKILRLFPYGVTDGAGLKIQMEDEISHALTCTLDLFHMDEEGCSFSFDARTPVSATKENCQDVARQTIEAEGFQFVSDPMTAPHNVPGDSDFVKMLLSVYKDVTGLKGECLAIGGGTYVHDLKNGVAFGAVLPGVDTRMHGADEFMDVRDLLLAAKVYAEAIVALCG